jgi:hypothetical protein
MVGCFGGGSECLDGYSSSLLSDDWGALWHIESPKVLCADSKLPGVSMSDLTQRVIRSDYNATLSGLVGGEEILLEI